MILFAKHIPLNLHKQIQVDIYVDLSLRLNKDSSTEESLHFVNKNGKLTLTKAPVGNMVDSWVAWNKSF